MQQTASTALHCVERSARFQKKLKIRFVLRTQETNQHLEQSAHKKRALKLVQH